MQWSHTDEFKGMVMIMLLQVFLFSKLRADTYMNNVSEVFHFEIELYFSLVRVDMKLTFHYMPCEVTRKSKQFSLKLVFRH